MDSPKSKNILGSILDLPLKNAFTIIIFFQMSEDFESSVGTSCINFLQLLFNL